MLALIPMTERITREWGRLAVTKGGRIMVGRSGEKPMTPILAVVAVESEAVVVTSRRDGMIVSQGWEATVQEEVRERLGT